MGGGVLDSTLLDNSGGAIINRGYVIMERMVQKLKVYPSDKAGHMIIEQCMPESMDGIVYGYEVPIEHVEQVVEELKQMFEQVATGLIGESRVIVRHEVEEGEGESDEE